VVKNESSPPEKNCAVRAGSCFGSGTKGRPSTGTTCMAGNQYCHHSIIARVLSCRTGSMGASKRSGWPRRDARGKVTASQGSADSVTGYPYFAGTSNHRVSDSPGRSS
jgi:hypothetical protein